MELTPHQSTAWHYRALCEMGRAGDLCGKTILTNGRRRSSVTLATSFVHQQATGRSRSAAVANKSSMVVEPNRWSARAATARYNTVRKHSRSRQTCGSTHGLGWVEGSGPMSAHKSNCKLPSSAHTRKRMRPF